MKSYNHLWEKYLTAENYLDAVKNATAHKSGKKAKYRIARRYRDNAEQLMSSMMEYAEHFKSAHHTPKEIYDGVRRKKRQIVVPNMKEQIVHHMVVNVIKPIFMHSMYEHSYGSIPGRGAHMAKRRIEKWIRSGGRDVKYCLKMDVRKYFDSVPHNILKEKLAKLIHDERFLEVLFEIVDAVPAERGIPIGFYTSQWIANWYLTELDHYIKEELGAKYYVRYMDDMVIFGGNKRRLHEIRKAVDTYLQERLGLQLKDNWQVFLFSYTKKDGTEVGRDLDFMGFRFFRSKTILRKALMLKATRKARRICRKGAAKNIHDIRQMLSYIGWLSATDTYGMYQHFIKPFVSFHSMKRYAGRYQRRENRRLLCGNTPKAAA